jgi:type IX secretion system PorP/SprF family membrane protein
VQAGMNIPLKKGISWRDKQRGVRDLLLIPTFLFKHQGSFDQLDLGTYVKLNPLVVGVWYRGLPIKPYELGLGNNESLVGLLGVEWENLSIGYSYDYTISALGARTGGAHELSLRVLIDQPSRGRGQKKFFRHHFPCPKF